MNLTQRLVSKCFGNGRLRMNQLKMGYHTYLNPASLLHKCNKGHVVSITFLLCQILHLYCTIYIAALLVVLWNDIWFIHTMLFGLWRKLLLRQTSPKIKSFGKSRFPYFEQLGYNNIGNVLDVLLISSLLSF